MIESVSDSDWAGHFDRVSSSCGHVYVNGNAVYCFVRKQGAISLSSCEAELIACCSTAAEAIYIKHIVQTLSSAPSRLLCRLDSSSARSLLQKKGVSKVRHLDTKLLWLQRLANDKRAEFAAVSTHVNTSDIGTKLLSTDRYHFLMCRLGYKGFVSSMKEQVKYEQIQAKVLRLLMVMDSMRVAAGSSVSVMSDGNETNMDSSSMYGLHIESVLSIHLPAWSVVVMIVAVTFIFMRVLMLIGMMCSRERHHGHQRQNDEGEEGDEHDEPDQPDQADQADQPDQADQADQDQPDQADQADQPDQADQADQPDQAEYQQHAHGPPTLPEAIAEFYERELGLHAVRDPHHAVREQHVHGNPPQHDRMVNFPDLRYCPGHGQVYHVPQCGCLKSGKRITRYTADDHERLHLAACGQCQPTVLPGSGAPIVRRRRTRR